MNPQYLPQISQIYADETQNNRTTIQQTSNHNNHTNSLAHAHIDFFKNTSVVVSMF